MKALVIFLYIAASSILSLQALSLAFASEKPTQHLQLPDVTTSEEAKKVFIETTSELQDKRELNQEELNEIHITTYSLEKAVAYFVENMKGDQQTEAKKLAELVERIHLTSETDQADKLRTYLQDYSNLASAFAKNF